MKDIILITGPTGFVGFKTLLIALEAGHAVRAVIRRPTQAETLRTHAKIAPYASKLEFVVVPDLAVSGAFDDKLDDVVAVLHIASPLSNECEDYNRDLIDPAVQMCTSLLNSAIKAPSVRRVVVTSSMVTLIPFSWLSNPDDKVYTAANMNPDPTRNVANAMEAYWTSKALARSVVHDFIATQKPHFEIVQILPGVIFGADDRAASVADLRKDTPMWDLKLSPVLGLQQSYPMVSAPIDVVDVARAHVDAIRLALPGNKDYLFATEYNTGFQWDSMIDIAQKLFPSRCGSEELPLGGTLPTTKWRVDCKDTEDSFGWKFTPFSDTVHRAVGQYLELLDAERQR